MIDDLIKSIKLNIYERVTSPLLGTFVISWCLWNYRFIIILLSSKPPEEKFKFIDAVFFKTWWPDITFSFGGPLIVTLIFIFLYPYPAKWIYGFWHSRQKELKEKRQEIDDETPITREEQKAIKRKISEIEQKYYETLRQKDIEISRLKDKVDEFEGKKQSESGGQKDIEISELMDRIGELELTASTLPGIPAQSLLPEETLEPEKVAILKSLSKKTERSTASELMTDLLSLFNYEPGSELLNVFTHYIDSMVTEGLVSSTRNSRGLIESVELEKNGRTYLVEKNIIKKGKRNLLRAD